MRLLFVLSFLVLLSGSALAGAPPKLPVQGYLTDTANMPVNGTLQIQLQLYGAATGGSPLYSETQAVNVADGDLTVYLGSNVPLDLKLFRSGSVYLGITLQGEAEMTPRLQLGSVPYAAYAEETAAVPPGAVMMFDLDTCPAGWSPLDAARGRAIVGVPAGGSRSTVGTALTNLENRSHTHAVDPAACTTSSDGLHTHNVDPLAQSHSHTVDPAAFDISGGSHNHVWANWNASSKIWSTWKSDGSLQQLVDWTNGVDGAGATGDYPIEFASAPAAGNVYTAEHASHTHSVDVPSAASTSATVDIPPTLSTNGGAHTHTCDAPAAMSTPAPSGMPYIQLLVCRKD